MNHEAKDGAGAAIRCLTWLISAWAPRLAFMKTQGKHLLVLQRGRAESPSGFYASSPRPLLYMLTYLFCERGCCLSRQVLCLRGLWSHFPLK